MPAHEQPQEYFMIEYGFDGEAIIESFFSSNPEKMSQPEIYGMTWEQVQKTLHEHYKNMSKAYSDIADDWLTKTCHDHFLPPKTNQSELWDEDEIEW